MDIRGFFVFFFRKLFRNWGQPNGLIDMDLGHLDKGGRHKASINVNGPELQLKPKSQNQTQDWA